MILSKVKNQEIEYIVYIFTKTETNTICSL